MAQCDQLLKASLSLQEHKLGHTLKLHTSAPFLLCYFKLLAINAQQTSRVHSAPSRGVDAAITLYFATLKMCAMHLKTTLKAKIPKSSGKVPCAKKLKSKIENLRFTRLFKSVSQYCELNKVQQECLFAFVSRSEEFKYFDEMPLGEVSTVRLVVSLVFLRRFSNDELMASATPPTCLPANFCYYCSNTDSVFFILFPQAPVHLRPLLAQHWRHVWGDHVVWDLLPVLQCCEDKHGGTTGKTSLPQPWSGDALLPNVNRSDDAGVGIWRRRQWRRRGGLDRDDAFHLAILKLLRSKGSLLGMHQSSAFWLTL